MQEPQVPGLIYPFEFKYFKKKYDFSKRSKGNGISCLYNNNEYCHTLNQKVHGVLDSLLTTQIKRGYVFQSG
jgi:hypothetical protein